MSGRSWRTAHLHSPNPGLYWTRLRVAMRNTTQFDHQDWLGTERARTDMNGNEGTYYSSPFGDNYFTPALTGAPATSPPSIRTGASGERSSSLGWRTQQPTSTPSSANTPTWPAAGSLRPPSRQLRPDQPPVHQPLRLRPQQPAQLLRPVGVVPSARSQWVAASLRRRRLIKRRRFR